MLLKNNDDRLRTKDRNKSTDVLLLFELLLPEDRHDEDRGQSAEDCVAQTQPTNYRKKSTLLRR